MQAIAIPMEDEITEPLEEAWIRVFEQELEHILSAPTERHHIPEHLKATRRLMAARGPEDTQLMATRLSPGICLDNPRCPSPTQGRWPGGSAGGPGPRGAGEAAVECLSADELDLGEDLSLEQDATVALSAVSLDQLREIIWEAMEAREASATGQGPAPEPTQAVRPASPAALRPLLALADLSRAAVSLWAAAGVAVGACVVLLLS